MSLLGQVKRAFTGRPPHEAISDMNPIKEHPERPGELLISLALLAFSGLGLAWMAGAFAVPVELQADAPQNLKAWSAPGFLAFPAVISILASIVGVILLLNCRHSAEGE